MFCNAHRQRPAKIAPSAKSQLRFLYLAKHASGDGSPDSVDGNHATYHHELRSTLEAIGLNVTTAQSFDAVERKPDADFVIPRSEEHTSELQSLMRISYAVFCLTKKTK